MLRYSFCRCYIKNIAIQVWTPGKRHTQLQVHPENNQQVCTHAYSTSSHTGMEAQTNTQMPQPACHLSADRRNTPATSSQSAFHHSVTTCQLQSPSLRHTALIFTNCAAAWDTTQPCQKYDIGRITLLHLLAYTHAHTYTHVHTLSHACACVWKRGKTLHTNIIDISKSVIHMLLVTCTYFNSFTSPSALFLCLAVKETLCMSLCLVPGILPRPPVSSNDRLIYWLTDSANSACIHSKPIRKATLKNYHSAPTHIYTPEAKNRRLGGEGGCIYLCIYIYISIHTQTHTHTVLLKHHVAI